MTLQRRPGGYRAWTKGSNIRYVGIICSRGCILREFFPRANSEFCARLVVRSLLEGAAPARDSGARRSSFRTRDPEKTRGQPARVFVRFRTRPTVERRASRGVDGGRAARRSQNLGDLSPNLTILIASKIIKCSTLGHLEGLLIFYFCLSVQIPIMTHVVKCFALFPF